MAEHIVEIEGAGRSYGTRIALENVDLQVNAREVVGVVGPNGGGKSTLLMLMAGLVRPTSGSVKVCGTPADRIALESAGLVGLVTARPGLYPLLTGWENLDYFGGLFGLPPSQVRERTESLLDKMALGEHMDRQIGTWSTGTKQKLSLVRALMVSPRLLLFDEPTANLDPIAANVLYREMRERADAGLAGVVVTHDLAAADAFCDRILLVDGSIVDEFEGRGELPEQGALMAAFEKVVSR